MTFNVLSFTLRPKSDQSVVNCDKWREISNNTGKNPIISPTSVIERSLKVNQYCAVFSSAIERAKKINKINKL